MDTKEVIRREVGRRMAAPWSSDEVFADHIYDALTRASLLATPEMVEAAEALRNATNDDLSGMFLRASSIPGCDTWGARDRLKRIQIAREALLAAERPKGLTGLWRVDESGPWIARHSDGRVVTFARDFTADIAACAAFVAEQNAREAR